VQPRFSPDADLPERSNAPIDQQASRPATAPQTRARSAVAAPVQNQPWTKPNVVSPTVSHNEQASEEEEREVFEL
jgi:hypothetical protein